MVNLLAEGIYFPMIRLIYKTTYQPITATYLSNCPENSLGATTLEFLNTRKLQLIKGYELHDIKHALLEIETDVRGEILMQYFEFGNGNKSPTVWVVLVFGPLLTPEYIFDFYRSYKRGKQAKSLSDIHLENQLSQPVLQLRKNLNILPLWKKINSSV